MYNFRLLRTSALHKLVVTGITVKILLDLISFLTYRQLYNINEQKKSLIVHKSKTADTLMSSTRKFGVSSRVLRRLP